MLSSVWSREGECSHRVRRLSSVRDLDLSAEAASCRHDGAVQVFSIGECFRNKIRNEDKWEILYFRARLVAYAPGLKLVQ